MASRKLAHLSCWCGVVGLLLTSVAVLTEGAREAREKSGGKGRPNRDKDRGVSSSSHDRDYAGTNVASADASASSSSAFCELEVSCKGDDATASGPTSIKVPIKGPQGPPGMAGEKGERGEDGLPGLPGLPGLSAPSPQHVAFFVGLSENIGPVKEHTSIVFDRIVTNIGQAYDPRSGRFTSPVNGTYQFNVVISAQGRQKAAVMIVKNGGMVATVWAESIPYWATASNVVVLSLERDDQVWLLLLNRASYLHGYMYTTFSGFLIFEN